MTAVRVGDWVRRKHHHHQRGEVVESGEHIQVQLGEDFFRYPAEEWEHCAPDPLPERLPVGTKFRHAADGVSFTVTGKAAVRDGDRYQGIADDTVPIGRGPMLIDADSYHVALHAEQDARLRELELKQMGRNADGTDVPTAWHRTDDGLSPAERLRRAAVRMRTAGRTLQKIGDALGVTKQRVAQLLAEASR